MDYPGEKLLIRLWETLAEKGIGSLLRPWQIRREGKALAEVRRDEMLMLAQAQHDADQIRAGSVKLLQSGRQQRLSPVESNAQKSLGQGADWSRVLGDQAASDALRREVNVSKAVLQAEAELESDAAEPPPKQPDADWLYRWRDAASSVSTDEMQHLWGRVLAGELRNPGTVSLRTIEFLRNLSQSEAKQIERLSPFVVENSFILRNDHALGTDGPKFGDFHAMQELGVVSGAEAAGLSIQLSSVRTEAFIRLLEARDVGLLVTHADPQRTINLPVYKLTPVGKEIMQLGSYESNVAYLKVLAEEICTQGFGVSLVKCVRIDPQTIRYFDAEELCGSTVETPPILAPDV